MPRLIVVDEEAGLLAACRTNLESLNLEIAACTGVSDVLRAVQGQRVDVAIVDLSPPNLAGLEVYELLRRALPDVPVIVTSATFNTQTAIEAMKRGAFDYLVKPLDGERLRTVVRRALELMQLSLSTVSNVSTASGIVEAAGEPMIGQSPAMQEVYKAIGRVASQDVNVLVLGESGTGKELVARAVHHYSRRSERPFVAINCAAIPESLLESELFGHEKGAFTGAEHRRTGKFEHAHGGTVFLDEIADMSAATQAKVLRLIQQQQFERVGGTETVATDVRVIAATNRNLSEMVSAGSFRQDLFYRINGFTIELPPLRKRPGDVALLTDYYIQRFNREMGRHVRAVAPEALHWLQMNAWPGNVRELQSTIKYAMIKATGDVLTLSCFPPNPLSEAPSLPDTEHRGELSPLGKLTRDLLRSEPGMAYRRVSAMVDEVVVQEALAYANGNQLQAAALLGISRTTLRAKLRSMGLTVQKHVAIDREPN
jgi:two-component system nitrogen regulation response regulator GlnG